MVCFYTLLSITVQLENIFGLSRVHWCKVITDQVCSIVRIHWRSPATIMVDLQALRQVPCWVRKAKATCNNVLREDKVESNTDNLGCLTVEAYSYDTYERWLQHWKYHFKPIQGDTIGNKGYNSCHNWKTLLPWWHNLPFGFQDCSLQLKSNICL